ncbi:MAG: hypothetical protein WCK00_05045, partial [Deltaproteobacteria bacterium]
MRNTQLMLNFPNVERRFIPPPADVAIDSFFPEEEADKLAQIESYNKHLFRPNTYLHKWWARRSGVTFRYILKQLSAKSDLRDFYTPGGLEGLTILDPMMGGATTLHEAIRLGANVIGYDVDPIPVLQARASLTEISLQEKQAAFDPFLAKLEQTLSCYFETSCPDCSGKSDMQFLLYGLRRRTDKEEAIFVDSFTLREEANGDKKTIIDFYPSLEVTRENRTWSLIDKDEARKRGINDKNSELLDIPFADRYIPLVMMGKCAHHGQFFKSLDVNDLQNIDAAASQAATRSIIPGKNGFRVPQGPKSNDLIARGVTNFSELFSHRQLIYLSEAKRGIDEAAPEHRLWLALLVSTSLEFNSMLCGYKGVDKRRPGAIRHVFSHHAYSFPCTALENNPVFEAKTSGTLRNLFDKRILKAGIWAQAPVERRWSGAKWGKVIIDGELDMGQECATLDEFTGKTRPFMVRQNDSSALPLPDQA